MIWLLAGTACLSLPAQATAVAPAKGERYDGESPTGVRVFIAVNASGTRLSDYDVGGELSCSDGRKRAIGLFARGERPTAIGPDGSFSYASREQSFSVREKVRNPVKGTAQTTFSGTFTGRDAATVSVTTTFRSSRFTCTATTPLTLGRDGTRAAPFRGPRMATGIYRARGREIAVTALDTLAPGDFLNRFRFRTRVRCGDRSSYASAYNFDQYLLSLRDTGLFTGSGRFSLGRGYLARERYRVTIGFRRSKGRYRVGGSVRLRSVVTRGGRRVTSCGATRRFSGGFARGPKNLFQ